MGKRWVKDGEKMVGPGTPQFRPFFGPKISALTDVSRNEICILIRIYREEMHFSNSRRFLLLRENAERMLFQTQVLNIIILIQFSLFFFPKRKT